jgi:dTDP-4-amino-4,6-dideoxygalactose transaminase
VDRDGLLERLAAAEISARRGIMAAHRQAPYARFDTDRPHLPVTEQLTDNTLILPLFHQMSADQQERVLDVVVGVGVRG